MFHKQYDVEEDNLKLKTRETARYEWKCHCYLHLVVTVEIHKG